MYNAVTESDNADGLHSLDLTSIEGLTYNFMIDALGCICACIKLDQDPRGMDQATMEEIKSTIIYHEQWIVEDEAALNFGESPFEAFETMQWEFSHHVHLREKVIRLYLCFMWITAFLDARNKWNIGGDGWFRGRLDHALRTHESAIANWKDGANSIRAKYRTSLVADELMDTIQGFEEQGDMVGMACKAMIDRDKLRTRCLDLTTSWDKTIEAVSAL